MLALEFAAFWLSGLWTGLSPAIVPVVSGSNIQPPATPQYKSWLINATDGDTYFVIPHGFMLNGQKAVPDMVQKAAPFLTVANSARPNLGITVDQNNIYITKQAAVGSGSSPLCKIVAEAPQTFIE